VDERTRALARWSALAIVAIAVVRCLVSVQAQVRFDTDPAINPEPFAGLGPTGSFALDVVLLLASGMAFLAEGRSGRGVHGWLVACALLPGLAMLWHGYADAIDLFRGATWLAAAVASVAAAHLARDPAMRRLLTAGCIAVALPLALRGAEQLLIDHPETVRFFERHKAETFAERGWSPDSPAAQMFERRLQQLEASAWFGLANIFSATMAFGALAFGGLGIAALRTRPRAAVASLLLALPCLALLAINGSKGALLATALGTVVLVIGFRRPRLAPVVGLGFVALAAIAPALRGLAPESFLHEKSLLFRFQYLEGAITALRQSLPFGLGPDGFQSVYMRVKPPRSPEDVVSAHAMVVDWVLLLGPLAIGWVVIVVRGFIGRCGSDVDVDCKGKHATDLALPGGIIVAAVVCAVQAIAEEGSADLRWIGMRAIGALALVGGIALVDTIMRTVAGSAARAALLAAVVAVFAQAQIEMILFQPGTVVWAFLAIGVLTPLGSVGADSTAASSSVRSTSSWTWAGACALFALAIGGLGLVPQFRQDRLLDEASAKVAGIAEIRAAWPKAAREIATGEVAGASQGILDLVRDSAGVEQESRVKAAMTTAGDARSRIAATAQALQRYDANQRSLAADLLQHADSVYPQNRVALEAAVKQLAYAGRRTLGPRRAEIVEPMLHASAIEVAKRGADRFKGPKFTAMLADLWLERARATGDAATLDAATKAMREAIRWQPRRASLHADLADLLAAQLDLAGAAASYRAALAIDADLELDPLARFNDAQRGEIETRVARVARVRTGGDAEKLPAGWPLLRAE